MDKFIDTDLGGYVPRNSEEISEFKMSRSVLSNNSNNTDNE